MKDLIEQKATLLLSVKLTKEQMINELNELIRSVKIKNNIFSLYQEISKNYGIPVDSILLSITADGKKFEAYHTNESENELHFLCDIPIIRK